MYRQHGIFLNGEWYGDKVVVNDLFKKICSISSYVMIEFVKMINDIDDIEKAVSIKKYEFPDNNTIDLNFSNEDKTGIARLHFKLRNGVPVLLDRLFKIKNNDEEGAAELSFDEDKEPEECVETPEVVDEVEVSEPEPIEEIEAPTAIELVVVDEYSEGQSEPAHLTIDAAGAEQIVAKLEEAEKVAERDKINNDEIENDEIKDNKNNQKELKKQHHNNNVEDNEPEGADTPYNSNNQTYGEFASGNYPNYYNNNQGITDSIENDGVDGSENKLNQKDSVEKSKNLEVASVSFASEKAKDEIVDDTTAETEDVGETPIQEKVEPKRVEITFEDLKKYKDEQKPVFAGNEPEPPAAEPVSIEDVIETVCSNDVADEDKANAVKAMYDEVIALREQLENNHDVKYELLRVIRNMTVEEFLEITKESYLDDYGEQFTIINKFGRADANIIDNEEGLFLVGNKLYRWGETLYLTE